MANTPKIPQGSARRQALRKKDKIKKRAMTLVDKMNNGNPAQRLAAMATIVEYLLRQALEDNDVL